MPYIPTSAYGSVILATERIMLRDVVCSDHLYHDENSYSSGIVSEDGDRVVLWLTRHGTPHRYGPRG